MGISALYPEAILKTATVQTRTQAIYSAAAQGVVAMSSELDLSVTVPSGTSKIGLNWNVYGEEASGAAHGFIVYKDIDGGGYNLLAASRDGSANYWSITARPSYDTDYTTTANNTVVSIYDTSPDVGSVVTYRLYLASIRSATATNFYWNRCGGSTGAAFQPSGSSSGELICYA